MPSGSISAGVAKLTAPKKRVYGRLTYCVYNQRIRTYLPTTPLSRP